MCGSVQEGQTLTLTAAVGYVFTSVVFASFGTPSGGCGSYSLSASCNFPNSVSVIQSLCIGKSSCSITASVDVFGSDPCVKTVKTLSVQLGSGLLSAFPTQSPFKGPTSLPSFAPTLPHTGTI